MWQSIPFLVFSQIFDRYGKDSAFLQTTCMFHAGGFFFCLINAARNGKAWLEREFGRSAREMNLRFSLEQWWWPLQAMGWGAWEFDLTSKREDGLILVNLYDGGPRSAVAFFRAAFTFSIHQPDDRYIQQA